MIGAGNWRPVIESLRHRDHRLFNATLTPALTAQWAQRAGIGWLAWELTGSPTWLGIVAAADLLPVVLLAPFAGVAADRATPVRMMRLTQGIIVLHGLAIWLMTATGAINIWWVFALSLVTGINQPFSTAARMVFFPTLVPKQQLGTAIALNSTIFNGGRALGPAIAGLMIGPLGIASVFLLNFVFFGIHFLNLFRVGRRAVEPSRSGRKGVFGEIGEGLRYTARHPGIAPLLLLLFITSTLARPLQEMLPGFAGAVFSRGPEGLGWMLTSLGAGALAGAVWLTQRGAVAGLTSVVILSSLVVGAAMAAFAFSGHFGLALGFLFAVGFAQTVIGTGCQTLMQTAVAGELRGRVMSIYALVNRGTPAVGAVGIGWVAEIAGLPGAVAGAGAACVLAWMLAQPRLKPMARALETTD